MANPIGIDPATCFKIEAKIEGFCDKQSDGGRRYVKGRTLRWIVDSDRFSLCELISYLCDEINWGSSQKPRIWGKYDGKDTEVVCESQILQMFTTYQKERIIPFRVVVCDIDAETDFVTNVGTDGSGTHPNFPCTPSQAVPSMPHGSDSQVGSCDPVENALQTKMQPPDQSDEDDSDYEPDEYVGLDDEAMYLSDDGEENVQQFNINSDGVLEENVNEPSLDDTEKSEPSITHDIENPIIKVGSLFPDVAAFRKALRQFAIKKEFEFKPIKSDKTRFTAKCKHPNCHWRIHASLIQEPKSCMVKNISHPHTCPSTSMVDGRMASQSWVAERVTEWLKKNPSAGPKTVKEKLEDDYNVTVKYGKAWAGYTTAMKQVHGPWEESFQMLFNYKGELEKRSPGTIVEIDCERVDNKMLFSKVFVALKPCVDGFLSGCRPYLAVDSTHLTGKYHGQLATACAIDGHNWLYPVAYAVFDAEDAPNWTWFFNQLKRAIGTPPNLVISSDADKGLDNACATVFPQAEHRECMRHLMKNFKKKFHGKDFVKHMWLAARSFDEVDCAYHLEEVKKLSANAIVWLKRNHKNIWCKSKFSEMSKCDYVNNNISESFNSWIRHFKSLHIVDLLDQIRQLLMVKFDLRRKIGRKFQGQIIPSVLKELNALSRSGKYEVRRSGDNLAEVTGKDSRHIVDLEKQECTCRAWQVTGKPCVHAMKFICHIRGSNVEHYIHEYYSVAKFRLAYAGYITPMTLKKQWIKINPGFKVHPPNMKRPAGRPRKGRFKDCLEPGRKRHQCKKCKQYGHQQRTCKEPVNPSNFEPAPKRTRTDDGQELLYV